MERERKEDALIMTAPINCDEDHESDHNIILHHGNSYDNDFQNEERCDVMR